MEHFDFSTLEILADLRAKEAAQLLPTVTAKQECLAANTRKAEEALKAAETTCDDNNQMANFLVAKRNEICAELAEREANLRPELWATRESFSFKDQVVGIRTLIDSRDFIDREYDDLQTRKRGLDDVQRYDALAARDLAKALESNGAALLSHISSVSALVNLEEETGPIGLVSARTERLKSEAKTLNARYESSRENARAARAKYEDGQRAIAGRAAFVTRGHIAQAI